MDIVPDPPGTWNFNEVYLYEELMEADLHAIVSILGKIFTWHRGLPELLLRFGRASPCRTHTFSRSYTRRCAA